MALLSSYLSKRRLTKALPYVTGSVLDLGCGSGDLLRVIAERVDSYYGTDFDPQLVESLRDQYPHFEFEVMDLDTDRLKTTRHFTTIVMLAVIEHVFNLKHLMLEVIGHLEENGRVLITTPTPFGNDWVHAVGARLGLFSQVACDDHISIFNRKRFEILATEVGLQLEYYTTFEFGCNQLAVLSRPTKKSSA